MHTTPPLSVCSLTSPCVCKGTSNTFRTQAALTPVIFTRVSHCLLVPGHCSCLLTRVPWCFRHWTFQTECLWQRKESLTRPSCTPASFNTILFPLYTYWPLSTPFVPHSPSDHRIFSYANSSPFKLLLSFMHSLAQVLATPSYSRSQLNYSLLRETFFISITRLNSFIFSFPTTSTLFHPTYNFKCICVITWFMLNSFTRL